MTRPHASRGHLGILPSMPCAAPPRWRPRRSPRPPPHEGAERARALGTRARRPPAHLRALAPLTATAVAVAVAVAGRGTPECKVFLSPPLRVICPHPTWWRLTSRARATCSDNIVILTYAETARGPRSCTDLSANAAICTKLRTAARKTTTKEEESPLHFLILGLAALHKRGNT